VVYPDSDKFLVSADIPEGGSSMDAKLRHLGKIGAGEAQYFDGEEE